MQTAVFGEVRTSTGALPPMRFPGQWFQSESGLHQNWMRDYDPTTGRYLQPDPLGLVDGASVYGYARQNPGRWVDPRGEEVPVNLGLKRPFTPKLTGIERFWENYSKMIEANWRMSDKYFHCMANCESTRCLPTVDSVASGYTTSKFISFLREATDTFRGQHPRDWTSDEFANSAGREGALKNPEATCREICSDFRPHNLPVKRAGVTPPVNAGKL